VKIHPALLLMVLAALPVYAQRRRDPPPPEPIFTLPAAVTPGATTEITFHKAPAGERVALWTTFPAQVEFLPREDSRTLRCRLTIPAHVPVGVGAFRLYTTAGASSLQLLMVDDLPSIRENGKNTAAQSPQPLEDAVAVDGACEPVGSDFYSFTGKKDQRVSIDVVAGRLGSKLDPVLRLLDASGREIAYCDDSPGALSDARIAIRLPADGQYLIELRDVNYEGGPDFRYRLRLGDFPLAVAAFPAGGRRGANGHFTVESLDEGALGPMTITLPADAKRTWLDFKRPGGRGSAFVPVLCDDAEELLPVHDNTDPHSAAALQIPSAITGKFDVPGRRRYHRLPAKKNDRVTIRARTRSLNSTCDAVIGIFKPDGSRLAQSKSAVADDASVDVAAPADGTYLVTVEELTRSGGPGLLYRLEVEPASAASDFALAVETEKIDVAAGGTFRIKVTATRKNFDGPITLSLKGDAATFAVKNNTIPAGKPEIEMEVKVPQDATPKPMHFGIVGTAKIANATVERAASTNPALKQLFPRMLYPPPELDGLVGLGVRAAERP
jgi:hypothetical protein